MPTVDERVVNKALSGAEVKILLRAAFDKLLDGEGRLSDFVAYGRFGADITLRLMVDNPFSPESRITIPVGEKLPLADATDKASLGAHTLSARVDSPNKERVRLGLPVPVVTKAMDGTTQIESVKYPPQPELGDGDIALTDTTETAKRELGLSK